MTISEVYNICMPKDKRKKERNNIWVSLVVRPISILCTLPLVKSKVKPSQITFISIVFSVVGFFIMTIGYGDMLLKILGWGCFFIWAILDGVDGNLARCQGSASLNGELWDALGGYASMVLIYMASSITAFFDNNLFEFGPKYLILIIGNFNVIFSIFPRLIAHKKQNITAGPNAEFHDKASFGFMQIVAMNIISVSGFMQVFLLICIVTHTLNLFTAFYAFVNFIIMILSLCVLLRSK